MSKLDDVQQRNVALASFDSADVVAREVCQLGESLLRQSALGTQPTQSSPELDSRIVSGWHASSLAAAHYKSTHDECDMIGRPKMLTSANAGFRLESLQRMDVVSGITAGVLRPGIAQGGYVAYVEVADSGIGFRYCVTRDGICLSEGDATDFPTAKRKAEKELRLLCSAPLQ